MKQAERSEKQKSRRERTPVCSLAPALALQSPPALAGLFLNSFSDTSVVSIATQPPTAARMCPQAIASSVHSYARWFIADNPPRFFLPIVSRESLDRNDLRYESVRRRRTNAARFLHDTLKKCRQENLPDT